MTGGVHGRMGKRTTSRCGWGAGFTLVELLVVILIIGMLMGILLPTLAGVRETARRTKCTVNLKQFGVGLEGYRRDSKSEVLPYVLPFYELPPLPGNDTMSTAITMMDVLDRYMDAAIPQRQNPDDPDSPFMRVDPFFCPKDMDPEGAAKTGMSYEYWPGGMMLFRELFRFDIAPQKKVTRWLEVNPNFPILVDGMEGWHKGNSTTTQNALYFGDWHVDWLVSPDPEKFVGSYMDP